jgi:sensor histidine kinase regulating citrate/malate metabolism
MILFGSTVILFITYQHSLERENEYVQVKREVERLQTEKSYYDILEHQNQQLRIYAHDAKNHLAAIQNLNTDPRVSSYIEKLSGQLNSYANHCHSGNQILDVIISKYAAACELKDIHFEYDVRLCNLSGIDDFDLVAILGNLLDNALTAAEQSQQSELSVATALRNSYCVIVIENSCDTAPILRGNRLVTTKENGGLHGCGLKSVARTLKKYQGDFDWEYNSTSHRFITTVMLKQQTMNHE